MQSRFDAGGGKLFTKAVAIIGLDHIKMVDVPPVVHLGWNFDIGIGERTVVVECRLTPLLVPAVDMLKFHAKNSTFDSFHAHIQSRKNMFVPLGRAMITPQTNALRELAIIRSHGAAFT